MRRLEHHPWFQKFKGKVDASDKATSEFFGRDWSKEKGGGNAAAAEVYVRALGADHPMVEHYGDILTYLLSSLIREIVGGDHALAMAIRVRTEKMADDLAGPDASPLERILAERIAVCWLDASNTDRRYFASKSLSFDQEALHSKLRDRAHHRLMSSIKMLALVRKLLPRDAPAAGEGEIPQPLVEVLNATREANGR